MIPSLEVRWFLPGPIPDAVNRWFKALGPLVDAASRTDRYLIPTEGEDIGMKLREGRVEAKQRLDRGALQRWGAAEACPESWRKWILGLAAPTAPESGWIDVPKTRRQRWVQMEGASCALELASVQLEEAVWWSVCLEASGGDAESRQRVFREATRRWLERDDTPVLTGEAAMGYPAWLRQEVG